MIAGHAPRKALPSASLGNIPATTLSVEIRSHIGTKHPPNWSTPKKNMVVYVNGLGLAGSACGLTNPITMVPELVVPDPLIDDEHPAAAANDPSKSVRREISSAMGQPFCFSKSHADF